MDHLPIFLDIRGRHTLIVGSGVIAARKADLLLRAGFADPVLDADRLTVTYSGLDALARDLRAAGAGNTAPGRRPTLTAPGRWRRVARS